MILKDYELRENREIFGNDSRAINRHSVRQYQVPGHDPIIFLDKTLDANPPFYKLYYFDKCHLSGLLTFAINIPFDGIEGNGHRGESGWGEGLTWKNAERVAGEIIERWFENA